ncbi:hypothetical protein Hanom_Chr13g01234971 [Helianthus anomalus]
MTNISVFYVDYHIVFYIHSCTMVCLKFLRNARVWILCFRKMDFVAEPHPHFRYPPFGVFAISTFGSVWYFTGLIPKFQMSP